MKCSIDECDRPAIAKCFCKKHYNRMRRGTLDSRTLYDPNEIVEHDDHAEIKLYDKHCVHIASAKIDKKDVDKVKGYKWCLGNHGYAQTTRSGKHIKLHRIILDLTDPLIEGDHKSGDRLDNRRDNLRVCNRCQNTQNARLRRDNTSGAKGVYWSKDSQKWGGKVRVSGRYYFIGYFDDLEEATKAVNQSRLRLHGEFARAS